AHPVLLLRAARAVLLDFLVLATEFHRAEAHAAANGGTLLFDARGIGRAELVLVLFIGEEHVGRATRPGDVGALAVGVKAGGHAVGGGAALAFIGGAHQAEREAAPAGRPVLQHDLLATVEVAAVGQRAGDAADREVAERVDRDGRHFPRRIPTAHQEAT